MDAENPLGIVTAREAMPRRHALRWLAQRAASERPHRPPTPAAPLDAIRDPGLRDLAGFALALLACAALALLWHGVPGWIAAAALLAFVNWASTAR